MVTEITAPVLANVSRIYRDRAYQRALVVFVLAVLISLPAAFAYAVSDAQDFDHFATGFPLENAHQDVACESCHINGVFKGTPRSCSNCHNGSGLFSSSQMPVLHINTTTQCLDCHTDSSWAEVTRVDHSSVMGSCASCHNGRTALGKNPGHIQSGEDCEQCHNTNTFGSAVFDHSAIAANCSTCHNGSTATGKSAAHVQTTNICEDCHNTFSFIPANRVDHSQVLGSCASCHNNSIAQGKPADHIRSSQQCDDCHTTNSWEGAVFDHANVTGNCFSCHNGSTATGKNAQHIGSTNTCEDCHSTVTFAPVTHVDHGAVIGSCNSCHNGQLATGKPVDHIPTTAQCDSCHNTNNWDAVAFDHQNVAGTCDSCHNSTTATGKPGTHFQTNQQCDTCHRTNAWLPDIFVHSSPNFPNGHRGNFECADCHQGNAEANAWRFPAYQPDCAGCHANDYEADEHLKTVSPPQRYSVSELRDCAGSCHIYTDNTLTVIQERRNAEHRVSDGDFD